MLSSRHLTCSRFLSTNVGASPCSWFNTVPRLCGPWLLLNDASFVSTVACGLLLSCLSQASPKYFQFLEPPLIKAVSVCISRKCLQALQNTASQLFAVLYSCILPIPVGVEWSWFSTYYSGWESYQLGLMENHDKSKGTQICSVDTASGGLWVGAGSLAQKRAWLVSWDGDEDMCPSFPEHSSWWPASLSTSWSEFSSVWCVFLKNLLKDNCLAHLAVVQQLYPAAPATRLLMAGELKFHAGHRAITLKMKFVFLFFVY